MAARLFGVVLVLGLVSATPVRADESARLEATPRRAAEGSYGVLSVSNAPETCRRGGDAFPAQASVRLLWEGLSNESSGTQDTWSSYRVSDDSFLVGFQYPNVPAGDQGGSHTVVVECRSADGASWARVGSSTLDVATLGQDAPSYHFGGGPGIRISEGTVSEGERRRTIRIEDAADECAGGQVRLDGRALATTLDVKEGLGYVAAEFTVPANTPQGRHRIALDCPRGTLISYPIAVNRTAAAVGDPAPALNKSPVFAAIPKPSEVPWGLRSVALTLAVASALILLIGFPADIVNKTIEENRQEIEGWFLPWTVWLRRRRTAMHALRIGGRTVSALWASPRRRFCWFTLAAALLTTLIDPAIGIRGDTMMLFFGLLVALPVTTLVYAVVVESFARRFSDGVAGALFVLPLGLVLAAFCTLLSVVAGFVPGYVFGLIAGYATAGEARRQLSDEDQGRSVLAGTFCLLAVALLAWVALERTHDGTWLPLRMLDAVLSAVFLLSVQTLVFGLIPLHMMDGRRLLAWSRRAWLAVYAVAVICFVHLLVLNRRDVLGQGTAPAFVSTLALFIGFGALSLAFWAYFRYRPPRPVLADPPTPPVPPTPPAPPDPSAVTGSQP
ncbi:FGLLP motif-containing membrane protein [Streptomyces sp. Je 1-369]|uniref:FGLLP motif-containing membrane protein n=1 Tax=Streptomyces sp. Je 1-369 TaxID=2966192 RepID=UPI00228617A1|nr:FGLLP motif-containing membrane protein [Streptomyces sp. Je 1-369]WAL93243.1 hypothetical protein NOO62_01290 [Streptomyces sp. Je 1-369]